MKKILYRNSLGFLYVIIFLFIAPTTMAQEWQYVGVQGFENSFAAEPDLSFNSSGIPYVAYKGGSRANVMNYPCSWNQVGATDFSGVQSVSHKIAISSAGIAYVVYVENTAAVNENIVIKRFDGTSWVSVGSPILEPSASFSTSPSLAIRPDGVPYVAYIYRVNSPIVINEARVRYFDGTNWVLEGSPINNGISEISLAFNGSVPYVAFRVFDVVSSIRRVDVRRFDGSAWISIGGEFPASPSPFLENINLVISPIGIPHLVYGSNEANYGIRVASFTTGWSVLGSGNISGDNAFTSNLAFHPITNQPYVVSRKDDGFLDVKRYDGASWLDVGNTLLSTIKGSDPDIAFHPITNEPYITFENNDDLSVMRFAPIYYSKVAGGNWNDPATWGTSCGTGTGAVPTTMDNVVICNGFDVVVNGTANCGSLVVDGTLQLSSGTLTVNATAASCGNLVVNGTLQLSSGALIVNGTTTIDGTISDNVAGGIATFIGQVTNNGSFGVTSTGNSFNFQGGLSNTSTFTATALATSNTFNFSGNNNSSNTGTINLESNNINLDAGVSPNILFTNSGTMNLANILGTTGGGTEKLTNAAGTITVTGTGTMFSNLTLDFTAIPNTIEYAGINTVTRQEMATTPYDNITLLGSNAKRLPIGDITVTGNWLESITVIGGGRLTSINAITTFAGSNNVNVTGTIVGGTGSEVVIAKTGGSKITLTGRLAGSSYAKLRLVTGIVETGGNEVFFDGYEGGSTTSYIQIPLGTTRTISCGAFGVTAGTPINFPIGTGSTYTPISLESSVSSTIKVGLNTIGSSTPLPSVSSNLDIQWCVESLSNTSLSNITLGWIDPDNVNGNIIGAAVQFDDTIVNWSDIGGSATATSVSTTTSKVFPLTSPRYFSVFKPASVITSTTPGLWTETSTWLGGVVPSPSDDVVILHDVTIPASTNVNVGIVTVQSGATLSLTNSTTVLSASVLNIDDGSSFDIKTASSVTIGSVNSNGVGINRFILGNGGNILNPSCNTTGFSAATNTELVLAGNYTYGMSLNATTFGTSTALPTLVVEADNNMRQRALNFPHTIKNIVINGGQLVSSNIGNILGDVTVNTGTKLEFNSPTFNVLGDFTINGNGIAEHLTPVFVTNIIILGTTTVSTTGSFNTNTSTSSNHSFRGDIIVLSGGTFSSVTTGTISFANSISLSGAMTFQAPTVSIAAARTVTNNGTVTINGNLNGLAATSTWTQGASGVLNYSGANEPMATGVLTATATGNTVEYNRLSVQGIKGTTYHNLIISSGGVAHTKTLGANSIVNGDLTIANATILDVNNLSNYTIDLKGNWINSGSFLQQDGTVTFNGTANAQTITGTTTFNNLVINNNASLVADRTVTLGNNVTVSTNLTLTNGRLVLGTQNLTYGGSTAIISRTNGWIETNNTGAFIRNVAGSNFTFPVGDNTAMRLVTLATTTAGNNSVRFIPSIPPPAITGALPAAGKWDITIQTTSTITFTDVGGTADATGKVHKVVSSLWAEQNTGGIFPDFVATVPQTSGVFTVFTPAIPNYYTLGDATWNANTNWSLDGTTACNCNPAGVSGADIIIRTGHTVTVANATDIGTTNTIDLQGTGVLTLSNGNTNAISTLTTSTTSTINIAAGTLNLTTPATTTINGTVKITGTGAISNGMTFANGSTYEHARNGGVIPIATWGATSTCLITGITTTTITGGFNQTFGNFTWNCTTQAISQVINANMNVINDLNVTHTNKANSINLFISTSAMNFVTRTKNLIIGTEARFFIAGSGGTSGTLEVTGDYNAVSGSQTGVMGGVGTLKFSGTQAIQNFFSGAFVMYNGGTWNIEINKSFGKLLLASNLENGGAAFVVSSKLIITSGILDMGATARTVSTGELEGSGTIDMSSNANNNLNIYGANSTFTGTLTSVPQNITSYLRTATPQDIFVPSGGIYGGLVIGGTGIKTLTGAVTVNGNLTINGGADLTTNNFNIDLKGNWTNNGTFTAGTGAATVTFNGVSDQNIQGTSPTTFRNLTINKASNNVTLANNVTVSGVLNLTGGKVVLGTNNLAFNTISGQNSTNYIVTNDSGNLISSAGGANRLFPVGNSFGAYQPIELSNAAANASVRFGNFTLSPPNGGTGVSSWFVTNPSTSSFITLEDPQPSTATDIDQYSKIRRKNGTLWDLLPTTPSSPNYTTDNLITFSSIEEEFALFSVPDYQITTGLGSLAITDLSGDGDELTMLQDGTNIRFTNTTITKTYRIDGGTISTFATPADISLTGITSVTINAEGGNNTINIGTFTDEIPTLRVYGGTDNDIINFIGSITFITGNDLEVDLQIDGGTDQVNFANNTNISLQGSGTATIKASRNIAFDINSSLRTTDGNLTLEANQQTLPTTGNFVGISLTDAIVEVMGVGILDVKGKGGDGAFTQVGIQLTGAASRLRGGSSTSNSIRGTGGAGTSSGSYGVLLGSNTQITSNGGGNTNVIGTGGGATTSTLNTGVWVQADAQITANGTGIVTVNGTGGSTTGDFNIGVYISDGTGAAQIFSGGGDVTVTGTGGGTGASSGNRGVYIANTINGISAGGNGAVTVTGTGGSSGGSDNVGVNIQIGSAISYSGFANVTITGNGGAGAGANNHGLLLNGAIITSTNSSITVTATKGGSTNPDATDILLEGGGKITSPTNGIVVNASTGGFSPFTTGVDVTSQSLLLAASKLSLRINGSTVDAQYQQLNVAGNIDLNAATLNTYTTNSFIPTPTQQFTIVNNTSAGTTTGVFNGGFFPEGGIITNFLGSGLNAQITYVGGTGNDIVLTVMNPASITLSPLSSTAYCVGETINIPFTTTGTFGGTNTFTAQLSDEFGSFATPTAIGSNTTSPISATIPNVTGAGYKVRVVSSNPSGVISDESAAFTINALPTINLSVSSNTSSETTPSTITVNATASSAVIGDQTVDLTVTGTGMTTGDYTLNGTAVSTITITILNGQTTGTVNFIVVDDTDTEGDETAIMTISNTSSCATLGTITTQNIVITDNDLQEINVQGNGSNILSGSIGVSPTNDTDFGDVLECGANDNPNIFTIQNIGAADLTVSNITVTGANAGDFILSGLPTFPATVAATTGTQAFTITFNPSLTGNRTALVTITNNDADEGSYTFVIEGNGLADNVAPVADLASLPDILSECEVTSLIAPTATDNCGGIVIVTNDASLPISGEGTNVLVTWTFDDGNGNTSTQTQNVIIDDVTAPSLDTSLPTNTTVSPNQGCLFNNTNISNPSYIADGTASDNCGMGTYEYVLTGSTIGTVSTLLNQIFNEGETTVTWKAIDINGNESATNSFTVIVTDSQAPALIPLQNFTRNADRTNCYYTNTTTTTSTRIPDGVASDNCGVASYRYTLSGATLGDLSSLDGLRFNVGLTTIRWIATDRNGNVSSPSQFTVTVVDAQQPIIQAPPSVIRLTNLYGCTSTRDSLNIGTPRVTDNCLFRVFNDAPAEFPIGETTVIWTAVDSAGNRATAEQIITIQEQYYVAPSDSLILAQIYNELNGQNWNRTWDLSTPVSTWSGITVRCGRVASIDLSNNNLIGTLPSSVLNLARRVENDFSLNIGGNKLNFESAEDFVGTISNFIYSPQEKIYSSRNESIRQTQSITFNSLTEGNFNRYQWYRNQILIAGATSPNFTITNALPSDAGIYVCEVTNTVATQLTLERNPITLEVEGFLSVSDSLVLVQIFEETGGTSSWTEIWDLTQPVATWQGVTLYGSKIKELDLSSRNMTGRLPNVFDAELFSELRYLSFFNNNLEGQIPATIGNITTLTYLDLDKNKFEGSVPALLGNLVNLQALWLSRNNLTILPNEIGNMISLKTFYLNDNKFTQLPQRIGDLNELLVLNVSDNELTGLPNSITNLRKLTQLYANRNYITAIPTDVQNLVDLTVFEINTNELTSLPNGFIQLSNLSRFKVSENKLEFDDLLPYANKNYFVFEYAPQALINQADNILTQPNTFISFAIQTEGSGNNYQWFRNGNSVATTQTLTINRVAINDVGIYTAQITNPSLPDLILQRRTITLNVECQTGSNFEINQPVQTVFCESQPFGLKLEINDQFIDARQIRWKKDGIILAFANEKSYTVTIEGIYTAEILTANGCTIISNAVEITVLSQPEINIDLINEELLTSTLNSQEPVTYQWLKDGTPIQDGFESTYTPTETGEYSLLVLTEAGCSAVSETIIFTQTVTGIEEPKEFRNLEIFPNPNNGNFFIDFGTSTPNGEPTFILIDAIGRKIILKTERISSTRYKVNTNNLTGGMYYLQIETKDGLAFRKFVIEE